MVYALQCIYDTRQSFYRKAQVMETKNKKELYSYGTLVASIKNIKGKTVYNYFGKYSQTTTRHQKEFFKQNGLSDKELKELFKNGKIERQVL